MPLIEAKGIVKRFPGVLALDGVDFSVAKGSIHCLVGENGAGKSTLVKVLTGVYQPDQGRVEIGGEDALANPVLFEKVAYVPQELSLFPNMTVAENLFIPYERSGLGKGVIRPADIRREAEKYIERFRIHAAPSTIVAKLSVSDRQLLQIAHASAMKDFNVLILDEPTTSLSMKEIERFYSIVDDLKRLDCGIVFISHKFDEIYHVGHEVTVMRNGRTVGHGLLAEVSQRTLVHQMSGEDINTEELFRPEKEPGEIILEVEGLSGDGFCNIDFNLHEGEILGVAGLVGSGRSEIMQTLFGYLPRTAGKARYKGTDWVFGDPVHSIENGLYYLPEERKTQGILPNLSLRQNIGISLFNRTVSHHIISSAKEKALAAKIIDEYSIKTPSMDQLIKNLSGGNQQKAIIGRVIENRPAVMIVDEPTKGIDVKSKNEIYHLLKRLAEEERVGIIMISSELKELLKCANRILTIYSGRANGIIFMDDRPRQSEVVGRMLGLKENE